MTGGGERDPYVVRVVGGVDGVESIPALNDCIGQFVQDYKPHLAALGEQWLWVTPDPAQARKFTDLADVHGFYTQAIGVRPWDGRPDRPLAVFHIAVSRLSTFQTIQR